MHIGVLFGCVDRKNSRVSIPGIPGGLIIYQGNPSICPKRTPVLIPGISPPFFRRKQPLGLKIAPSPGGTGPGTHPQSAI